MINKRSMTKAPSLINRGVDRKTPDALAAANDTRSESAIGILGERSAAMTFSMPQ
jgi:hypothetical protein